MRSVILQMFVSVDGNAAAADGAVDFVPTANAGDLSFARRQLAFLSSIDTILLGRVTYEMFSRHWPRVTSGEEKEFADALNALPKIVFSRTLESAPWGNWDAAKVVKENAAEEVARLKKSSGKDIVIWGSLSLAQMLMKERLIDEYQLLVCPVVLPGGVPLFRDKGDAQRLTLLATKSFDQGTVLLAYKPARTPHNNQMTSKRP